MQNLFLLKNFLILKKTKAKFCLTRPPWSGTQFLKIQMAWVSNKRKAARRTGPASYKRAKQTGAINKQSLTRQVPSALVEVKRTIDRVAGAPVNVTTTWSTGFQFPYIQGGDNANEREGRAVKIKGWELRVNASNFSTTATNALVRCVVVRTYGTLTQNPLATSIFFSGGAGSAEICALYNPEYAQAYTILADRVIDINSHLLEAGGNVAARTGYLQLSKSCNFIQSYYSNSGADVVDTQLHVFFVGNTGSGVQLQATCGLSFVEV